VLDGLHARFGRWAAKAEWFYGFRLALLTPLIDPAPVCWAFVPFASRSDSSSHELTAVALGSG
jgi:hypothetical protein